MIKELINVHVIVILSLCGLLGIQSMFAALGNKSGSGWFGMRTDISHTHLLCASITSCIGTIVTAVYIFVLLTYVIMVNQDHSYEG